MDIDAPAREAVDCGLAIHRELGPGLLESVYEMVLARALEKRGIRVERQRLISFEFDGMKFEDAFRIDLLAEGKLLIEVKAVEKPSPVHAKQVLTYLRLLKLPVGLLMNFGMATFKDGLERIANNHRHLAENLSVLASWRETTTHTPALTRLVGNPRFRADFSRIAECRSAPGIAPGSTSASALRPRAR